MNDKKEILQELQDGDEFLLTAHINPDGDSLGSMLGLALALKKMGKKVHLINSDPTPIIFSFLPGVEQIMAVEGTEFHFSTAIVLDCSDWQRVGKASELIRRCRKIINIDHHVTNDFFGNLNYVVEEAAATGELVYEILLDLNVDIDSEIATNLYTALMTDTGSFRHSNTTSNVFKMAAELTLKGAAPYLIAEQVYQTFSFNSLQLLGKAMSAIEISSCGKVAWLVIRQSTLQETGTTMEESESLISYLIGIQGVEVALLFKELMENKIKVGFRARGNVDVSKIAGIFCGGGHVKAAGCLLEENIETGKGKVLQQVFKALEM